MKKITTLLLAVSLSALVFTGCEKDKNDDKKEETKTSVVVEEKNMGLIFKFTGTNCYYCGDWGWTMFKDLISTYHKKDAVCIAAYSQNSFAKLLVSPIATDFDRRVPVSSGYPTFTGNFVDGWSQGATFTGMNNVISTNVNNHKNAEVIVNTAYTSTISDDKMTIKTTTKFFKNADGEYNIGVYILEDGIVASQSGPNGGANAVHENVLRAGNSSWGEALANGAISAGKIVEKDITLTLDPTWNKEKLTAFVIIWKKNADKYDFVNATIK